MTSGGCARLDRFDAALIAAVRGTAPWVSSYRRSGSVEQLLAVEVSHSGIQRNPEEEMCLAIRHRAAHAQNE